MARQDQPERVERSDRSLSVVYSSCFLQAAVKELGEYSLDMLLSQQCLDRFTASQAGKDNTIALKASELAAIQKGIRGYYGRGSRTLLLRIGRGVWQRALVNLPVPQRLSLAIVHWLPLRPRMSRTMRALASLIREPNGDVDVRALDLVLLDRSSDTALGQSASEPICWLIVGIIQEATYWAAGIEVDVEETHCRAKGEPECQFRIRQGIRRI